MKISQISFGRAVRINSNKKVAQKIADLANASNYGENATSKQGMALQHFTEQIFDDVTYPNGKAKVVELSPDEIYVYSGKEAAFANKLTQETNDTIEERKHFVHELPNRLTRKYQEEQMGIQNAQLVKETQDRIRNISENGINSRPISTIDVELEKKTHQVRGEYYVLTKLDYRSEAKFSHEHLTFDING